MKEASKKIIFIVAIILVVAVIAITAATPESQTVIFTDTSGNEIGTATFNGKETKISIAEEGYYDYINIAFKEAVRFYRETNKIEQQDIEEYFFRSVFSVETNFDSSYFEKIEDGFSDSELEDDTPFASVMVDKNGRILAAYGYKEDNSSSVYSLHKTYAGSSIKPLSVYAPAIEKGIITWTSQVTDSPVKKVTYQNEGTLDWPQNANGTYTNKGMLICDAIYASTNTVAVKTLQTLGVKESISFLTEKLNFNLDSEKRLLENAAEDEIYGNLALGYLIDGVSPLDMAGYYQIFINGGKYNEPWAVRSVTDVQGKIIKKTPESKKVISAATASIMSKLLQGVVENGTGVNAAVSGMNIAGKTGTSEDNQDNWFIGFNTKFVCSVWHGFNDDSNNNSHHIFSSIFSDLPKSTESFRISKEVSTVVYCKKSGGTRGAKCKDVAIGYYLNRNTPQKCTECQ